MQEVARSASGFIQRIDATAQKLDASVTDLRREVLNEQTLTNFAASIHNLRSVTEEAVGTVNSVNGLIATNGEQIGLAVSNIVYFSLELTRLAGSAQDVLNTNGTRHQRRDEKYCVLHRSPEATGERPAIRQRTGRHGAAKPATGHQRASHRQQSEPSPPAI